MGARGSGEMTLSILSRGRDSDLLAASGPHRTELGIEMDISFVDIENGGVRARGLCKGAANGSVLGVPPLLKLRGSPYNASPQPTRQSCTIVSISAPSLSPSPGRRMSRGGSAKSCRAEPLAHGSGSR